MFPFSPLLSTPLHSTQSSLTASAPGPLLANGEPGEPGEPGSAPVLLSLGPVEDPDKRQLAAQGVKSAAQGVNKVSKNAQWRSI